MNSIIIIGNGFDLAHGLKTSYKDFIDWLWSNQKNILMSSNISLSGRDNMKGYDWFREVWSSNPNNGWIKEDEIKNLRNNSFLRRISDKNSLQNWVDIENEYYKALIDCEKINDDIKKLNNEFSFVQAELEKYLNSEIEKGVKPIDKIKENLDTVFNQPAHLSFDSNTIKPIVFLNFNYTKVEDAYLNTHYGSYKNSVECIHIHGELNNPDNPVIFGYGDELDDNYHRIESLNDNHYLKMIKSIRYFQTRNYQKVLSFINSDHFEIFIMGHSCGSSDRTLLNTLFEHENCKSIKAFYYKNDDGDNFSDITMNISRNFRDKARMRKIVLPKPDCRPLS